MIVSPLVLAACGHVTTDGATRPTPRRVESALYRSAAEFTDARLALARSCQDADRAIKIDARDDYADLVDMRVAPESWPQGAFRWASAWRASLARGMNVRRVRITRDRVTQPPSPEPCRKEDD